MKWVDTISEDNRDPDILETTENVFWTNANLDAAIETVRATRNVATDFATDDRQCRKMPVVITAVNGEPLDGRHVLSPAGGQSSL